MHKVLTYYESDPKIIGDSSIKRKKTSKKFTNASKFAPFFMLGYDDEFKSYPGFGYDLGVGIRVQNGAIKFSTETSKSIISADFLASLALTYSF